MEMGCGNGSCMEMTLDNVQLYTLIAAVLIVGFCYQTIRYLAMTLAGNNILKK